MSEALANRVSRLGRQVRDVAGELAWRQWAALGRVAASSRQARGIVDPEALLLLSLHLADGEARMARLLPWWAVVGARLLSVQRAKNLASEYPAELEGALGRFARSAIQIGGDHRWRSVAGRTAIGTPRPKDVAAGPVVATPPSLMLRLRLGFGVGIKADVLAVLLGMAGAHRTVQQVARATRYHPRAVRRALEELAAARFVLAAESAPISYYVDAGAWTAVLAMPGGPPPWRPWADAFPLMAALSTWLAGPLTEGVSTYLLSSSARDLVERHLHAFQQFGVAPPSSEAFPGEAYWEPFADAVRLWVQRLLDVV
jgi:hypothetical protein